MCPHGISNAGRPNNASSIIENGRVPENPSPILGEGRNIANDIARNSTDAPRAQKTSPQSAFFSQKALERSDVEGFVSRFASARSEYLADRLAYGPQTRTADAFQTLSSIFEESLFGGSPIGQKDAVDRLKRDLSAFEAAARETGARPESAAQFFIAARIQGASENFLCRDAQKLCANEVFSGVMRLFASETPEDAEDAVNALERAFHQIESSAESPEDQELLGVIKETIGKLVEARTEALHLLSQAEELPDTGTISLAQGDFSITRPRADGAPRTEAPETLMRFGSPATELRDRLIPKLEDLNARLARVHTTIRSGDLEGACAALHELKAENAAGAAELFPELAKASLETTAVELSEHFGSSNPPSPGIRSGAQVGREAVIGFDWSLFAPEAHNGKFKALEKDIAELLLSVRNPDGSLSTAKEELLAPLNGVRMAAYAAALLEAPWVTPLAKTEVEALLAQADQASDPHLKASCSRAALELLHSEMDRASGESAAVLLLQRFGIDPQAPHSGGINGGLRGLTAHYGFDDFVGQYGSKPRFSPAALAAFSSKIADGIEPANSSFAAAIRTQADIFRSPDAAPEAKKDAFAALMRIFSVLGEFGTNISALENLLVPQGTGTTGPGLSSMLSEADLSSLHSAAKTALLGNILDGSALEMLETLSCTLGSVKAEPGTASAESFRSIETAAQYFNALCANDFWNFAAASAAAISTLSSASIERGTPLRALLDAGARFQAQPCASTLLDFISQLSSMHEENVRPLLIKTANEAAANAQKTGSEALLLQEQLESDALLLAEQFHVLRKERSALVYAAHALYAAEKDMTDPWRTDPAANAAFADEAKQKLAQDKSAMEALGISLSGGVRSEHSKAATLLALASYNATGLFLTREKVHDALGVRHEANMIRALRWELSQRDPTNGYVSETSLPKLLAGFREYALKLPLLREFAVMKSSAAVNAQTYQRTAILEVIETLGITSQEVAKIEKGVDFSVNAASETSGMHGQTAGLALLALNKTALRSIEDMGDSLLSSLVGHAVQRDERGSQLTDEDLKHALLQAAGKPLYERECAVLLAEVMRRAQAAGRSSKLEDILAALRPQLPKPEDAGSEEAYAALVRQHEEDSARYEAASDAIRFACRHNFEGNDGALHLRVSDDAEAIAILSAAREHVLDKTLARDQTRDARKSVAQAYDALLAEMKKDSSSAEERQRLTRELYDQLGVMRFNRGRYVLLAKTHKDSLGSGVQEFEEAWKKFDKSNDSALSNFRQNLAGEITAFLGSLGRTAASASGSVSGGAAAMLISDLKDPAVRRALRTAGHCALELAARALGKSVEGMLAFNRDWQKTVAAQEIVNIAPDQTEVKRLVDSLAPDETIPLAQLVRASLREILPGQAADAYADALLADKGKLASKLSGEIILRNELLRKKKYFAGLQADMEAAYQGGGALKELRGSRAALFHARQSAFFSNCLGALQPGSSVAIDRSGKLQIIGTKLSLGESIQQGPATGSVSAELEAGAGIELSGSTVFTKNYDGSITVSTAKRASANASASVGAEAGLEVKTRAGAGELKAGGSLKASASVGLSVGYTLTVENTLSSEEAGSFIEKLVSAKISAEDVTHAALAHTFDIAATASINIGASAALGFEVEAEEQVLRETVVTSEDESGSEITTTTIEYETGNTAVTRSIEKPSGETRTEKMVSDASDHVISRKFSTQLPDGTTITETASKAISTPFSEGTKDWTEALGTEASASASFEQKVQASVMKKRMPVNTATEYSFSGRISLRATASASNEGLSVATDLARGSPLEFEANSVAVFSVENSFTRIDNNLSGKTVAAEKRTACTFDENELLAARIQHLSRVLRAQGLSSAEASKILSLIESGSLTPTRIVFEGSMPTARLLSKGELSVAELCRPANYQTEAITLEFSDSASSTHWMARAVNAAGKALAGAFELSETTTKTSEIRINLNALANLSEETIASILDEKSALGLSA